MAGLIVAAAVALTWCLIATWIGPRIGYVDTPDDSVLKVHTAPAVPLGGVGVFAGFHVGSWIEGVFDPVLLVATSMVLILGLVDDRRGLSPLLRLGVELVAALVLAIGADLGDAPILFVYLVILTVFSINAVNLFDGLDGLAGSVGALAAVGVALVALSRGLDAWPPLLIAAALAGFLILGWHPARVFLGDAGAYVVGMLLAWAIIDVSPAGTTSVLIASGLIGVFALDLSVTVLRRIRSGDPLFEGDRSHLYDQLLERGFSIRGVVYVALAAQAAVVALVLAIDRFFPGPGGVALVAACFCVGVIALATRGPTSPETHDQNGGST